MDNINKSLHVFITDCSELLTIEKTTTISNLILSEIFNVSTDNTKLLLKNYPPKSLFIENNHYLITGCLIASDNLHYSYAKFNVEFKMQINLKEKTLCDYFKNETITIPANFNKGHIIYKFKTEIIYENLKFLNNKQFNFYLMNYNLPFEILNNSEIVILSNEFYQKPNVCLKKK